MDLLDWMAGQALAAMVEAESKESHKQLTNDGYEHEATHFPRGFADEDYWDGAAKASYACAAAMLAEKARREADHSEDTLVKDHSPNAGKVVEINRELVEALTNMLARDKRNTCQHEETHRGGVLWEICDNCKASWADDQGGKPPWSDPPEWIAAEAALAKAKGGA